MSNDTRSADADRIRRHVEDLFEAYLEGDLEELRRGRSADWMGFQIRSTRLVRGVDDYMAELAAVMGQLVVESYEFLDFEVEVRGDLALVYYIAKDHLLPGDPSRPETVLIRSLDVYERLDGAWTQIGSNICSVPDPDAD